MDRRAFLLTAAAAAGAALAPRRLRGAPASPSGRPFEISLAEWSLHRAIRGGALAHLDFPRAARRDYGVEAVEHLVEVAQIPARPR